MSETANTKNTAADVVKILKQLPREKQEYVSGYVQGIADASKELAAKQDTPA